MKRKLVQAGGSLAVTLPADVIHEHGLKKGMAVDVSVHPQTGAVTIRPGVKLFEDGEVSDRFERELEETAVSYASSFRKLAE